MNISAMILTEDGSKFASETLRNVCAKIFDFVVPRCAVDSCVAFRPASDNERAAMTANMWRSEEARDQRKIHDLCKSIATHLLLDDGSGVVFFHFDGDVVWGESSLTLNKYERKIVRRVREFIRGHVEKHPARYPGGSAVVEYAMRKLIHVAPFYSIESWLFASTEALRSLCRASPEVDVRLQAWRQDVAVLDQSLKPKDLAPIGTAHYPELATKLPTARLVDLGTSFCDTVIRTGNCAPLVVRLRHSWPLYVKQEYGLA